MGTGDLCRMTPAAVCHLRARQRSGTVPYGDCRRVRWGQYSEKIRFIEKSGVQDEGFSMWPNYSSECPPGSLPLSQSLGTGPSVNCGYCCPLCRTRGRYPGHFRFIEPQGVNGHMRPVPVLRGQYSGKIRSIEKLWVLDVGWSPCG